MSYFEGLPPTIRIGPYDVTIRVVEQVSGGEDFGEYSFNKMTISLRQEQPSRVFAVDTLLHEVVHGIRSIYDIKPKDDDERQTCRMGTGLTQVFKDNPVLLAWLTKSLG